jgi:hypothetical protein
MIAVIPQVAAKPRPLNERLWVLVGKEIAGTATPQEITELNELCASIEAKEGSAQ